MAVRSSMTALIARVRLLVNDPIVNATAQFADQDVQDVLDESRQDIVNQALLGKPTYTGTSIAYLDYYSEIGGWEDDYVIRQYLTAPVTPVLSEPIAGHFGLATSTLPPLYITGKLYDVYRAAADLLERLAARWVLNYDFSSDGASFHRSQAAKGLHTLAKTYRMQQRPVTISTIRSDIASGPVSLGLHAKEIDFYSSGNGR